MSGIPVSLSTFEADLLTTLLSSLETIASSYDKDIKKSKASSVISSKQHSMFENDEKDGDDRILPAKKHLFLLNNLYNIAIHLVGRIAAMLEEENKSSLRATAASQSSNAVAIKVLLLLKSPYNCDHKYSCKFSFLSEYRQP